MSALWQRWLGYALLAAISLWSILCLALLVYYGALVVNGATGEAWIGVWLGLIYGLPAWLGLASVAWVRRRRIGSALRLILWSPLALGLTAFGCIYSVA